MIQVDLPGAIAVGQIYAILSKSYLKSEADLFCHRLMGPVTLYMSTMFAPVGLFLLICWPAWEGMYWWQWVEQPATNPSISFFYIGFYLAMVLLGLGSYMIAHKLFHLGKSKVVVMLAIVSTLLTLAPFFIWPFTWYWVGSYADYHATPRQSAVMFKTTDFLYSWAVVMSYLAITSVGFGVWVKKKAISLRKESS